MQIGTDKNLTGYAWSSNVGWIKFGGLAGCPGTGACNARLNIGTNQLEGWARACVVTANHDCTGLLDVSAGGWDGWVSLNCDNSSGSCSVNNYQASAVGGSLSGFAWGSDVIGWLRLNGVTYSTPCTASVACSADLLSKVTTDQWCTETPTTCTTGYICDLSNPGGSCVASVPTATLTVTPQVTRKGNTVALTWQSTNATACDLSQSNPGGVSSFSWSGISGTETSQPVNTLTVFRLSCSDLSGANYQEIASATVEILPEIIER